MTKDPVGKIINATLEKFGDRYRYTIWPDNSTAKIIVILPVERDDISVDFLASVIDPGFSKSLMLEFAQADLIKEHERRNEP